MAKRCIPKIENAKENKVIVDGIRSLSEVEEFKKHFPKFNLIAIQAPPATRFKRLYHRQRSDDPASWEIFQERDKRESNVGLEQAIATAEHIITNEEELSIVKEKIKEILRKVEQKWMT
jgi:dephospho-CoA kinase